MTFINKLSETTCPSGYGDRLEFNSVICWLRPRRFEPCRCRPLNSSFFVFFFFPFLGFVTRQMKNNNEHRLKASSRQMVQGRQK